MANTATLQATLREERGKGGARRLRRAGRVPAVIYGHGEETRALSLDAHELEVLFSHISIENTIIELAVDGAKTRKAAPLRALVREVQRHPYRGEVIHVDFYQLHAGEKVDVEVPIHVKGTAAGVKLGGLLQQSMHDLSIRCLPEDIPAAIEVDVSALEIGDSIHVSELAVPEGVEVEVDLERTVCSVLAPTVVAVEEPVPTAEEGVGGEVEPELVRKRGAEEADQEPEEA
ncbi:MAG: 50S ribosomal protein L25/general stress protein Ctc [Longimicrobiales bacterium]